MIIFTYIRVGTEIVAKNLLEDNELEQQFTIKVCQYQILKPLDYFKLVVERVMYKG